jgi:hypothetical protein
MRTDLEYYLLRPIPDDKKERIKAQWKTAFRPNDPEIVCCCGQLRATCVAFRCFYCGEWYCANCAELHFKTEASADEQIEKEQGRWQDAI